MARLGSGSTTDTTSTSNELYYAGEAFRLAYDVGAGTGSRRVQTNFNGYKITAKAIAVDVTNEDASTAVPYGLCQIDSNVANDTFTTKANCTGTWVPGKRPALANETALVGGYDANVNLIENALTDASTRDGTCSIAASATGTYLTQPLCEDRGTCSVGTEAPFTVTQDVTRSNCISQNDSTFTPYIWVPNPVKGNGQFSIYIPSTVLKEAGFTEAPQPGSPLYIAYSVDYTETSGTDSAETRVIETDVIGFRWTPMFDITA